jgi:EAL domain-containing protein (putative c-di-GMP-specific phosphodiesterase class I)
MVFVSRTKRQVFAPGDIIMHQGETGDNAYLIEEGQVEVFVTSHGRDQALGKRGAGAIVGEMAIVDSKPRTASVRALTPCTLLSVSRDDFERRLMHADPVMKLVMQVILARYRAVLQGGDYNDSGAEEAEAAERASGVSEKAFETIRMTHDFREAILGYQLRLHYQPVVDIANNNKVIGFVALMRWHHPTKGLINPGVFIPIAEDSGLIVHASRWALREAVYMLNRLKVEHDLPEPWFVSLNFTGLDLAAEDFADHVSETLQATGVHPSRIKLEITERMLIDDPEGAIRTLRRCREAGLTVALDDFGTGYSSLSYLHKFPIDTMKIDRSFVLDMVTDHASLTLVKAIIALAKGLGMSVVAEGVEKPEEAALLLENGCTMVQGFLYARPMAEPDLVAWLQKHPA